MSDKISIALVGPTGVGKDTFAKEIIRRKPEWGFKKAIGDTTRAIRDGEVNGIDYNFLSENEFLAKLKKDMIFEYMHFNGNHYGISRDYLTSSENLIFCVTPDTAKKLKEVIDTQIIYLQFSNPKAQFQRLRERDTKSSNESLINRIQTDPALNVTEYDYILINEEGKFENSFNNVLSIIGQIFENSHRSKQLPKLNSNICNHSVITPKNE